MHYVTRIHRARFRFDEAVDRALEDIEKGKSPHADDIVIIEDEGKTIKDLLEEYEKSKKSGPLRE